MITYELFCRLRQLRDERQLNVAQIAHELALDERTDPVLADLWDNPRDAAYDTR